MHILHTLNAARLGRLEMQLKYKEENISFNVTHNTFYLRLYGVGHMVKDHSAREEARCRPFMGYSFRLATRDILYTSSHR